MSLSRRSSAKLGKSKEADDLDKLMSRLTLEAILRGCVKGFAKGALIAAVITLVTGGVGLIAAPWVIAAMGVFECIKEGIQARRFMKNLDKQGENALDPIDLLLTAASATLSAILSFGFSLVINIASPISAICLEIISKKNTSKRKFRQDDQPAFQASISTAILGIAAGVVIAGLAASGFGWIVLAGAFLGMVTGYGIMSKIKDDAQNNAPTEPVKSIIQSDKWNTASLACGAVVAIGLLFAPFTAGLSVAASLAIVGSIMLFARYVVPLIAKKISLDLKESNEAAPQKLEKTSTGKLYEKLNFDCIRFTAVHNGLEYECNNKGQVLYKRVKVRVNINDVIDKTPVKKVIVEGCSREEEKSKEEERVTMRRGKNVRKNRYIKK